MTRLTYLIIRDSDKDIYGGSFGPVEGKYGLAIVFNDKTPSGCPRPYVLLESDTIYETPESAKEEADKIIKEIRKESE